jgi:hypothetical protein
VKVIIHHVKGSINEYRSQREDIDTIQQIIDGKSDLVIEGTLSSMVNTGRVFVSILTDHNFSAQKIDKVWSHVLYSIIELNQR